MNKLLTVAMVGLAVGAGFLGATLYQQQSGVDTEPETGNAHLNWQSTIDFLEVTESDFAVATTSPVFSAGMVALEVFSEQPGSLWLYGISKDTDEIVPLCDDAVRVDAGKPAALVCADGGIDATRGEVLLFGFVTRSDTDEQAIQRFLQLRAPLPAGTSIKTLRFREAPSAPSEGLGTMFWSTPSVD